MTNCKIIIQIDNFGPREKKVIPFNDLECIFNCDTFEEALKLSNETNRKFIHKINNVKKDIKYIILVNNIKTASIIGKTEFLIPLFLFKKGQNFTFSKKCVLMMIESTKRALFGSFLNCPIYFEISANIKVPFRNNNIKKGEKSQSSLIQKKKGKIEFLSPRIEKSPNSKYTLDSESRTSKYLCKIRTPPSKSSSSRNKKNKLEKQKFSFNKKRSAVNEEQYKPKNSLLVQSNSKTITLAVSSNAIHTKMGFKNENYSNINADSCLYPQEEDIDLNDAILIEQNFPEINNVDSNEEKQKEKEILFRIQRNHEDVKDTNNIVYIQNLLQKQSKLILDYQLNFTRKYKELINNKNSLTENLLKNNNKLIKLNRKYSRLDELKVNNDIKRVITINANKKSNNNIITNQIKVKKTELKIFQHIFNKYYFEYDILKYSEMQKVLGLDKNIKSKLLFSCLHAVINSYGGVTNLLPKEWDRDLNNIKGLLKKYGIMEPFSRKNNKTVLNQEKIKAITEEDAEDEEDDTENFSANKNKGLLDKNNIDAKKNNKLNKKKNIVKKDSSKKQNYGYFFKK